MANSYRQCISCSIFRSLHKHFSKLTKKYYASPHNIFKNFFAQFTYESFFQYFLKIELMALLCFFFLEAKSVMRNCKSFCMFTQKTWLGLPRKLTFKNCTLVWIRKNSVVLIHDWKFVFKLLVPLGKRHCMKIFIRIVFPN